MEGKKKVIYLSGPITGVPNYWEQFDAADDYLTSQGYIVLSPSRLPAGLNNQEYMIIDLGCINIADTVLFLPGWQNSKGAQLERHYCEYIGKPMLDAKEVLGW